MLKSLVRSLLLTVALSISMTSMAAGNTASNEVSAGDARAARAVVEAQLQAFAAGQSDRAFSFAAAAIKAQFHDAAAFMEMVIRGYPMLVRPAATSFMRAEAADGVLLQGVELRDRDGRLWRARYELQQEADKQWRISGCIVVPDDGAVTT